MHVLARIGYSLAGLALIAPAIAHAGMPIPAPGPYNSGKAPRASIFRSGKLCADCQRAKVLFDQGVNVTSPPALPPGTPVRGGNCSRCGRTAVVVSGPMTPTPYMPAAPAAPSAVAYEPPGQMMAGGEANYVSNGYDPTPIGTVQPRLMTAIPVPGNAPRGAVDPAIMAATATVSEPVGMAKANRPHVLSHLFGFSDFGRERAERREKVTREGHASIPYGQAPEVPHELPASVVFGRNGR